jgi:hypothetical protein
MMHSSDELYTMLISNINRFDAGIIQPLEQLRSAFNTDVASRAAIVFLEYRNRYIERPTPPDILECARLLGIEHELLEHVEKMLLDYYAAQQATSKH